MSYTGKLKKGENSYITKKEVLSRPLWDVMITIHDTLKYSSQEHEFNEQCYLH